MTNSSNSSMLLEESMQMISKEFPKFSNKKINTVYFFYDLIKRADETIAPALFKHFCIVFDEATLSHECDADNVISQEEISILEDGFSGIIEAKLKALLRRKYDEKTFYEKMWYFIWKSDALSDVEHEIISGTSEISAEDKARAYALFKILNDKRIPYFFFSDGLSMSNDDYRVKCAELIRIRQQIRFILSAEIFEQKTEKASYIVKIIDELETYQDKTIAMVFVINELQTPHSIMGEIIPLLQLLEMSK